MLIIYKKFIKIEISIIILLIRVNILLISNKLKKLYRYYEKTVKIKKTDL